MKLKQMISLCMIWVLVLLMAVPSVVFAQDEGGKPVFKQEELDQVLAPVALYPDALLTQVLMASTYPLEIVQASRWAKQNKNLKGDALGKALEAQSWDPSVKSLVNFSQVLDMMNEKLDWTQKLGDAFLAQQKDVMDTVQKLRSKAAAAGNLKTSKEQKVTVEKETKIIIIEPASPQVIFVPAYNPAIVYGAWWYPAYPPYPVYPPAYVAGAAFVTGVAVGAAWGYAWGHANWHGGNVNINVNQNINVNNNINRNKYVNQYQGKGQGGQGNWQHDANHRGGAPYKDQATAQKYNRGAGGDVTRSRDAYRGRPEQGRQDSSRGGADQFRGRQDAGQRGGAFEGMNRGGSAARESSSRGQASRESMFGGFGGRGGRSFGRR